MIFFCDCDGQRLGGRWSDEGPTRLNWDARSSFRRSIVRPISSAFVNIALRMLNCVTQKDGLGVRTGFSIICTARAWSLRRNASRCAGSKSQKY